MTNLYKYKHTPYEDIKEEQMYLKQGILSIKHPKYNYKHNLIVKGTILKLNNWMLNIENKERPVEQLLLEINYDDFLKTEFNQLINLIEIKFNINNKIRSFLKTVNGKVYFVLDNLNLSNYLVIKKNILNKWESFIPTSSTHLIDLVNKNLSFLPFFQIYLNYDNMSLNLDLKLIKIHIGYPSDFDNIDISSNKFIAPKPKCYYLSFNPKHNEISIIDDIIKNMQKI
jgi:hypothetical protein